jgi:hypothetical protein
MIRKLQAIAIASNTHQSTEVTMHDQSKLSSKNRTTDFGSASRRQVFATAGAALIASTLPRKAAAYPANLQDSPPPIDEGFFFVVPGKNKSGGPDLEADRVFFISSSWLPLFEITDLIAQERTVTITPGTPAVVNWTGHGLQQNAQIRFSGPNLPVNEIDVGQTYKVELIDLGGTPDPNNFNIKKGGTLVNTTMPGSGMITKKGKKEQIVNKFADNWKVMYSEDVSALSPFHIVTNSSGTRVLLPPPGQGETYLAMSII